LLKKVVFLDRDGVINQDSPAYIKSWAEFKFLPGSIAALKKLTVAGFTTIIITNQSAVNRRMISLGTLDDIHTRMKDAVVAGGGLIKDIFFCPHHPDEGCSCRKPKPGMIISAREAYHIELESAHMIGDSAKDIECAFNARCGCAILVKTGNGLQAEKALADEKIYPDYVAADLLDAVNWITARS
jgi:D-glycero-D-manno-heptose 1,7-bisphosphate phosphatase